MNSNKVEVVFILDRSSSMMHLTNSTIKGYNDLLREQKTSEKEISLTTVLFNHEYEIIHNRVDIKKVKLLNEETYFARGWTALFDAIGITIDEIGATLRAIEEKERPEKVLFFIITDGEENSSRKYSSEDIKKRIKHQREKYSWEFIFLGANIEVEEYAQNLGIDRRFAKTYHYSEEGISKNFSSLCRVLESYCRTNLLKPDFLDDIENCEKDKK